MSFDLTKPAAVNAMVELRGWEQDKTVPSVRKNPDGSYTFKIESLQLDNPAMGNWSLPPNATVTLNIASTPHFHKRYGGKMNYAWFDLAQERIYVHESEPSDNNSVVRGFGISKGFDYIDQNFGKPKDGSEIVPKRISRIEDTLHPVAKFNI